MPSMIETVCCWKRAALTICLFGSLAVGHGAIAPIVPGYERLAVEESGSQPLRGRVLLSELNCVACHAGEGVSEAELTRKGAPDLTKVGERITPHFLREFLKSPHGTQPGTTMPDLLAGLPVTERDQAAEALVHFLVSQGGPIAESKVGGSEHDVERGRELFNSIGCAACHTERVPENERVPEESGGLLPLSGLAGKTTVAELSAFLMDPLKARGSGRMPSFRLDKKEAQSIAIYLLRDQLNNPAAQNASSAKVGGLRWEYYEIDNLGALPDFSSHEPAGEGEIGRFTLDIPIERRDNNYAIRFKGYISIPESGEYTFATSSDDGTRLVIDGDEVVSNDGIHPMKPESGTIELDQGAYPIVLEYFEGGGQTGLKVFWSGPVTDGDRRPIPSEHLWREGGSPMIPLGKESFTLSSEKVREGAKWFAKLRCGNCHSAVQGVSKPTPVPSLTALDPNAEDGCLRPDHRTKTPRYNLSDTQEADLRAALRHLDSGGASRDAEAVVTQTMAKLNCYACHERKGVGGPLTDRTSFFQSTKPIDLGMEARIPPDLTGVGAKLKPEALRKIVIEGDLHIRHYMATRMPSFGEENVEPFLSHIAEADAAVGIKPFDPEFSEALVDAGRKLVGSSGMACITCHKIAGQDALGIQGFDLAMVHDRLQPSWFRAFLLEPNRFKEETRMPEFWPEGESAFKGVLGGDTEAQINAIWAYLSLEDSMPLPEGIHPEGSAEMELIPKQQAIVHRTFMKDVGPRAIVAGYPEKVNVAFDGNKIRLAKAWRGRFFDASGVASGRTDEFLGPLGHSVIEMPPGPAFAFLSSTSVPWPKAERLDRDVGGQFQGYELDDQGRPTFKYQLENVAIREKPKPRIQPGGAVLVRAFQITSGSQPDGLYFLAAAGEQVESAGEGVFQIDGEKRISLEASFPLEPVIREQSERMELLIPIRFEDNNAELKATIEW